MKWSRILKKLLVFRLSNSQQFVELKVQYCLYKSLTLCPILNQMNLAYALFLQ
jgi:hypothetical protein